ncbi:hypothetical protein AMAG_13778 [Allomyces macrogynus ATCC 38327]|uniref:Muskelin N-terminal domain-containing protein n=1 Tax=Allomyces macrogynus (strain ATCC 38327) TaxID=578462 RepID=A0A0L0T3K9_ALLM3|nr:hypothetical protein AMAG_13778 [Allomyces macrogynus ATCC 38327]|eukprot:KNE69418.1 hypothetical protein AMAG_13778 [Allomyces macrogynus ATCC 38327]
MDANRRCMYVLGRYVESGIVAEPNFWRFDVESGRWTCLSGDTAADGGPATVYDHQMVLDEADQAIYVFGGRVCGVPAPADGGARATEYSGLYKYAIRSGTWEHIQYYAQWRDLLALRACLAFTRRRPHLHTAHQALLASAPPGLTIDAPIVAHLFDALVRRADYALAEKILDEAAAHGILGEAIAESPWQPQWRKITPQGGASPGARAGHQAVLDAQGNAIYLFGGWDGTQDLGDLWRTSPVSPDGFPRRRPRPRGTCQSAAVHGERRAPRAPRGRRSWTYPRRDWRVDTHADLRLGDRRRAAARFAHSLTVHTRGRTAYLFGGNPNDRAHPQSRLGDMWALDMHAPSLEAVVRGVKYHVRRARLVEMARRGDVGTALEYLREKVTPVAPDAQAVSELAAGVFLAMGGMMDVQEESGWAERLDVFDRLVKWFPARMRPPTADVADFMPVA